MESPSPSIIFMPGRGLPMMVILSSEYCGYQRAFVICGVDEEVIEARDKGVIDSKQLRYVITFRSKMLNLINMFCSIGLTF